VDAAHARGCLRLGTMRSWVGGGCVAVFGGDLFRVCFPAINSKTPEAVATLTLKGDARDRLHWNCTVCETACEHVGALFSVLLENKSDLGLAAPPEEREPLQELSEEELTRQASAERAERARNERMKVRSSDGTKPWVDYAVTNPLSGKTYRVALRGFEPGISYCSCPDFRTNTLGVCKHLFKVQSLVKRRFDASQLRRPYRRKRIAVHLRYDGAASLRIAAPPDLDGKALAPIKPLLDKPIADVLDLMARLQKLESSGQEFHVYPDAEEFIQERLYLERIRSKVEEIRRNPAKHPLRTGLLKIPLLPYQLDGVAFCVGSGRAVLADDMGLGKTIQGVGVAELLAREAGIRKVLIVCPASLKSQWRNEINRFCDKAVQLISGAMAERERLRPVLLRRTRESVKLELPERTDELIRITPTSEQKDLHDTHMQTVALIASKSFLTEMDLLRIRAGLLMCRMSANSTYLVNKEEPAEEDRKVVLFSEWTTMLDLIEPLLGKRAGFVRLDGSVPQKKRQALVHEFQTNPACRFFLATNAGSTGLNLQAANTVINVDLPWNPAVLEQRIARAHRMGQTRPVQVFILVTEQTLEENLLLTLKTKRDLSDSSSDVKTVSLVNNGSDLRARLEVLLGAKPEAPLDESKQKQEEAAVRAEMQSAPRREQIAEAGGVLFGAMFQFFGALVPQTQGAAPAADIVESIRKTLSECVDESSGKPRLTLTLPDRTALDQLAQTFARLVASGQS
jgi:hypothetical protein